jgi:hypothetical protein
MQIRTFGIILLLLACNLLACNSASAQQKVELKYDRIQFAEKFLNELYPELGPHRLITVQTGFGWVGSTFFYVGITPCSLADVVISPANNQHAKDLPKHCPAPLQADASSFFMASIVLGDKKPFLRGYGAGGEFLSGKLEAWHQEIIKHPDWAEADMLNALRVMNPRFGPAEKDPFARIIPVQVIEHFSGCRLNLSTAKFEAKRLGKPPDTDMQLGWTVYGHSRISGSGCIAEFEPFEGRLVRLNP